MCVDCFPSDNKRRAQCLQGSQLSKKRSQRSSLTGTKNNWDKGIPESWATMGTLSILLYKYWIFVLTLRHYLTRQWYIQIRMWSKWKCAQVRVDEGESEPMSSISLTKVYGDLRECFCWIISYEPYRGLALQIWFYWNRKPLFSAFFSFYKLFYPASRNNTCPQYTDTRSIYHSSEQHV